MRVQHIEQSVRGIYALDPRHRAGLEMVEQRIGRLRHLIWNGYHEEAHDELFGMRHMASEVAYVNGDKFRPAVARLLWNCDDLRRYLANNTDSLIDYGERNRAKMADFYLSGRGVRGRDRQCSHGQEAADEMVPTGRSSRRRRPRRGVGWPTETGRELPPRGLIDQDFSAPSQSPAFKEHRHLPRQIAEHAGVVAMQTSRQQASVRASDCASHQTSLDGCSAATLSRAATTVLTWAGRLRLPGLRDAISGARMILLAAVPLKLALSFNVQVQLNLSIHRQG